MKIPAIFAACAAAAVAALPSCGPQTPPSTSLATAGTTRKIVIFKKDAAGLIDSTAASLGISLKGAVRYNFFPGFAAALSADAVAALKEHHAVARVIDDAVLKVPSLDGDAPSPASQLVAETIPHGVSRIHSPLKPNAGVTIDATVAVIDSGVQSNHPDLNVARAVAFGNTSDAEDRCGHGTHVAGIIGARSNDVGVVGVAPGARIWALNVTDTSPCDPLESLTMKALEYVYEHRREIDVVNISLGEPRAAPAGCDPVLDPYEYAICRIKDAGIPVVVAAGNDARNLADAPVVPASFPEVIAVSAIADQDGLPGGLKGSYDDVLAEYSNFGPAITIAAPGTNIHSTTIGSATATRSGTSMAAPHVAGAAAVLAANTRALKKLYSANLRGYADYIKMVLLSAGAKLGSPAYFSGDRDNVHEPLLQVKANWYPTSPGTSLDSLKLLTSYPEEDGPVSAATFTVVSLWLNKPVRTGPKANDAVFWTTGAAIGGTLAVSPDGVTATVRPNSPLRAGTEYRLIMPLGLLMEAGGKDLSPRSHLTFTVRP